MTLLLPADSGSHSVSLDQLRLIFINSVNAIPAVFMFNFCEIFDEIVQNIVVLLGTR